MPLHFRNITATPESPVREWGVEGMLAAIDRGYIEHWARLSRAIAADPELAEVFEDAASVAESRATVGLIRLLVDHARLSDHERAVERLRVAQQTSGLTQSELAAAVGTSRTRMNSYLSGRVSPSMDVLVAAERIAARERALANVPELVLR